MRSVGPHLSVTLTVSHTDIDLLALQLCSVSTTTTGPSLSLSLSLMVCVMCCSNHTLPGTSLTMTDDDKFSLLSTKSLFVRPIITYNDNLITLDEISLSFEFKHQSSRRQFLTNAKNFEIPHRKLFLARMYTCRQAHIQRGELTPEKNHFFTAKHTM